MRRLAPLCLLLVLMLAANAGAMTAPKNALGNGGCIAFVPCDLATQSLSISLHSKAQESGPFKAGKIALSSMPRDKAMVFREDPSKTILYTHNVDRSGWYDNEPGHCWQTTIVELWYPGCGEMPKICADAAGYNIVELPDEPKEEGRKPVKQYFFQEVGPDGKTQGVFFKGAGFYKGCGKDDNIAKTETPLPRERVLVAGGTKAILEEVAMEFLDEVLEEKPDYEPVLKYRTVKDWGQSMIVGFKNDSKAVETLANKLKDGSNRPIVVVGGDGEGDLAKVLMKVGRSGGGYFKLPSKMIDSRVYLTASANTAFKLLEDGKTDSLAYQLFANMNDEDYTDETMTLVDIYGCKSGKETFKTSDDYKIGRTVAVKQKDNDTYIGENGVVCHFGNTKKPGDCQAEFLGEDVYEDGKGVFCKWFKNGSTEGNIYQTGIYSKKSVKGGGELRIISGLGACSVHEGVDEYKEVTGAFDSDDRSWIPLCSNKKRFPKKEDGSISCIFGERGYERNGYYYFGGAAHYCACAEIVKRDMKIKDGRVFFKGSSGRPGELGTGTLVPNPDKLTWIKKEAESAVITWTLHNGVSSDGQTIEYALVPPGGDETKEDALKWGSRSVTYWGDETKVWRVKLGDLTPGGKYVFRVNSKLFGRLKDGEGKNSWTFSLERAGAVKDVKLYVWSPSGEHEAEGQKFFWYGLSGKTRDDVVEVKLPDDYTSLTVDVKISDELKALMATDLSAQVMIGEQNFELVKAYEDGTYQFRAPEGFEKSLEEGWTYPFKAILRRKSGEELDRVETGIRINPPKLVPKDSIKTVLLNVWDKASKKSSISLIATMGYSKTTVTSIEHRTLTMPEDYAKSKVVVILSDFYKEGDKVVVKANIDGEELYICYTHAYPADASDRKVTHHGIMIVFEERIPGSLKEKLTPGEHKLTVTLEYDVTGNGVIADDERIVKELNFIIKGPAGEARKLPEDSIGEIVMKVYGEEEDWYTIMKEGEKRDVTVTIPEDYRKMTLEVALSDSFAELFLGSKAKVGARIDDVELLPVELEHPTICLFTEKESGSLRDKFTPGKHRLALTIEYDLNADGKIVDGERQVKEIELKVETKIKEVAKREKERKMKAMRDLFRTGKIKDLNLFIRSPSGPLLSGAGRYFHYPLGKGKVADDGYVDVPIPSDVTSMIVEVEIPRDFTPEGGDALWERLENVKMAVTVDGKPMKLNRIGNWKYDFVGWPDFVEGLGRGNKELVVKFDYKFEKEPLDLPSDTLELDEKRMILGINSQYEIEKRGGYIQLTKGSQEKLKQAIARGGSSTLASISGLSELTKLELRSYRLSDLSALGSLKNLKVLDLSFNGEISDLSPLSGLTNLEELWFAYTKVSDLSPLSGLTNLKELYLWNTGVWDLSPIRGLKNLRKLRLSNTPVADINPIASLTNLRFLDLSSTKVTDVSALSGLKDLYWLELDETGVTDVSPLGGLRNLDWLELDETGVTDVSPLGGLPKLSFLNLKLTRVSDDAVPALSNLPDLNSLDVRKTRITRRGYLRLKKEHKGGQWGTKIYWSP